MAVPPDPPWVAESVDDLLAGSAHEVEVQPDDGKSGSRFRRVTIDGERYFVKSLSRATDWIMRVIGDHDLWTIRLWRSGLMHSVPPEIDHTVVGMAVEGEGDDAVLTTLMRDVGDHLLAEGDEPVTGEQHDGFVDALAALTARTWGWSDALGLCPLTNRLLFFAPATIAPELAVPSEQVPGPIRAADEGWRRLAERAPDLHTTVSQAHDDPRPMADALAATPQCFLHGDWKMGNLGRHPDGRTILLDWAYPGAGPPAWDLAWYLSLNRARLPRSKEDTIATFRAALERRGVATTGWFDEQVELCLLANMVTFGWEKALGPDDELRWWEEAARRGARRL